MPNSEAHITPLKLKHPFLTVAILLFISVPGFAQTWTAGAGTSDWGTPQNWNNNTVPGVGSNVTIPFVASGIYPVVNSNRQINNLTLSNWSNGGTLTVNNGATLTVTGSFSLTPNAVLNVNGGAHLNHTGGTLSFPFTANNLMNINNGKFTTNANNPNITANLSASNGGELVFNNGFQISNSRSVGGASGVVVSGGNVTLNGSTSLTVDNMVLTGNLTLNNNGTLTCNSIDITGVVNISGGILNCGSFDLVSTGNFTMSNSGTLNVQQIQMDITGSATLSSPSTFTAANGSIKIGTSFTSNSTNAQVNLDNVDFEVGTNMTIGAHFIMTNGGSVYIPGSLSVTNSYNFSLGTATLNVLSASTISGNLNVQAGTANFLQNITLSNSGQMNVTTGTVNIGAPGPPVVGANFTLNGSAVFNLNEGTLNIYGTSTFTASGVFNANSGNINFNGNITFAGDTNFDAGTSTVTMTGDVFIQTQNNNNNGNVVFYNLVIEDNAQVTANANIFVNNNMIVDEDGFYENINQTTLNVVGIVIGEPQIDATRPYLIAIEILSPTSISLRFNIALLAGTGANGASNTGNYDVENQNETVVSAVQTDTNIVVLTFSNFTIQESTDYFLIVNNLRSANNNTQTGQINANHRKRFGIPVPPTFYSRQNGNWNVASSWSNDSHTGVASNRAPGQGGDIVIIGNSHTITVNTTVTLAPLASIAVDNSGTLVVNASGNLVTATKTVTGAGTFELQSGGSISIGSPQGISSSGATGNIQTTSRSFSTGANYTYNGDSAQITGSGLPATVNNLTINNPNGVELTGNVKSEGTLFLTNGVLTIPSGLSLNAPTKSINTGSLRSLRQIAGSKGWRLLTSPLSSTYQDLFSEIVTQGYTGATFSNRQPSVMFWDESYVDANGLATDNQRWRKPANATTTVTPGRGLFVYVFGDIEDDNDYKDDLPLSLNVNGQEHEGTSGTVDFGVTFTARPDQLPVDEGWNLVGNPFASTINWSEAAGWTKTNVDNIIYVWDPATAQFLEWNATLSAGSLGNGLIKPFQAFWVKTNDLNPVLSVNQNAKSVGGTFYQRHIPKKHPEIELIFTMGDLKSRTTVIFTEDARSGMDPNDAYKLRSLADTYIEAFTISSEGHRLAINNMPSRFSRPVEIPVELEGMRSYTGLNETVTFSWGNLMNIPDHWILELIDNQSASIFEVGNYDSFSFNLRTTVSQSMFKAAGGQSDEPSFIKNPFEADYFSSLQAYDASDESSMSKGRTQSRFTLRITPTEEDPDVPATFGLRQNYPNPFNPSTTIPVELAADGHIRISIYDITGRLVDTVFSGYMQSGYHSFSWNGAYLSSGVYIYRLETPEGAFTRKFTLLK